jgi:hypothetical protein
MVCILKLMQKNDKHINVPIHLYSLYVIYQVIRGLF